MLPFLTFVHSLQSSFTSMTMKRVMFCPHYLPLVPLSLLQEQLKFPFKSHYRFCQFHVSTHTHTHDWRFVTCTCVHIISTVYLSCVSMSVHLYCMLLHQPVYFPKSCKMTKKKKKKDRKNKKNFIL